MEGFAVAVLNKAIEISGPNLILIVAIIYFKFYRPQKRAGVNGGLLNMILTQASNLQMDCSLQEFFYRHCNPEFDALKNHWKRELDVLTDNQRSFLSYAIKAHEKGNWNHFCWLYRPKTAATQDWYFRERPIEDFLTGEHYIKFRHSPRWKHNDRQSIRARIAEEIKKPWWKTRYDVLQLVGMAIGVRGLQVPWLSICTDKAKLIRNADDSFPNKTLVPEEINQWCKEAGYEVYGT